MISEPETVLLIGGNGFIGKSFARFCSSPHLEIVSSSSQTSPELNCNILDQESCLQILDKVQPSVVINLAASGVSPDDRKGSMNSLVNTEGPKNLLVACEQISAKPRLIQVTTAISSRNTESTKDEYVRTKRDGVRLARDTGLPFMEVALNNTYGLNQPRDRFVAWVLAELARGREPVLSNPSHSRDFTYVLDVVRALEHLIVSGPQPATRIEIGTGIQTSMKDLVELARRVLLQDGLSSAEEDTQYLGIEVWESDFIRCLTPLTIGIARTREDQA